MKTVIIIILLFFLPFCGFSQQSGYKWQIGEELTYGVTWTFIRLGIIKIKIYDSVQDDGSTIYKTKLIIDRNMNTGKNILKITGPKFRRTKEISIKIEKNAKVFISK